MDETENDLDTFLAKWWGKEGNVGWGIKTSFVDLFRQHGKEKVLDAIIIAAEQNKKSLAYVKGILNSNGEKPKQGKFEKPSQYEQERKCPDCGKPVMAMYYDQHRERCRQVETNSKTISMIAGIAKKI